MGQNRVIYQSGFSLVELSIVLVILGLLTGGILTGQSLIRAAELRSVVTEFKQYQTAVHTFRDKYFALPGDMINATDFWGAATAGGACATTAGTGTQTCNGNGDGKVLRTNYTVGHYNESFTFWQHLTNAGLIEGSMSGKSGPLTSNHYMAGTNTPQPRLPGGVWTEATWDTPAGNSEVLGPMNLGNFFRFEKGREPGGDYRILTPEEAWGIDKKVDDGRPGHGNVIGIGWNNECMNASASDDFDADYNLTDTSLQCALYFRNAF